VFLTTFVPLFAITFVSWLNYRKTVTAAVTKLSEQAVWPPGSSVTLTFDHLTLKLLRESHLRWVTFVPNLGTLGLWVIELFAMGAWFRAGVVYPSKDGHPSRH